MAINLNLGPLTTIFTPPASCLDVVTSGAGPLFSPTYSIFAGHFGPYEIAQNNCYPKGAASINFAYTNFYYSPGHCPLGYITACAYTAASFDASVTASLCCPLGFDCAYANWPHVCSSRATTPLTNVFVLTGITGTLPGDYTFSTVTPSPTLTVWNDGIPVAWAATDLEILALLGSTTTTPTPQAAPSTAVPAISPAKSPITSIQSSTTSSSPGLTSSLGLTPSSSSLSSQRDDTSSTGTTANTSGPPAPYSSGSSASTRSSPTISSPLPSKNATGFGSPTTTVASGNRWFSGNRGKVRIALIVVIPIVGLAALIGIFFCFRHYDLSIKKRSPLSPDAKPPAIAAAEADSTPRYELGSGQ